MYYMCLLVCLMYLLLFAYMSSYAPCLFMLSFVCLLYVSVCFTARQLAARYRKPMRLLLYIRIYTRCILV